MKEGDVNSAEFLKFMEVGGFTVKNIVNDRLNTAT